MTAADAVQVAGGEIRVGPRQTLTAGNYRVKSADGKTDEGFSLNPPPSEANLSKVPAEAFAPLGATVVAVDKKLDLGELVTTSGGTLPLFPLLVLLVFAAFAAESVLANRFYRGGAK